MKTRKRKLIGIGMTLMLLLSALGSLAVHADDDLSLVTYRVTIHNLAGGQPLSPPIAATHNRAVRVFQRGQMASPELEAIAEGGDTSLLFDLLDDAAGVTAVTEVGVPLTPNGHEVGDFTDTVTFDITARPGDRLSLATMLICSNDGFTGLDSVRLPRRGSRGYWLRGYDAGSEDNTEMSADIVDACTDLGVVALPDDPDGNEDDAVDTQPHQMIKPHPNIAGVGDLSADVHGWTGPVAEVTIERIAP